LVQEVALVLVAASALQLAVVHISPCVLVLAQLVGRAISSSAVRAVLLRTVVLFVSPVEAAQQQEAVLCVLHQRLAVQVPADPYRSAPGLPLWEVPARSRLGVGLHVMVLVPLLLALGVVSVAKAGVFR
jgi:hypothetical protein